jgi:acetyltransferase-like isoleucine patch superfamily enzyme
MLNRNNIGKDVHINKGAILESPVAIMKLVDIRNRSKIGKYTFINRGTTVFYNTKIGRYCSIGKGCEIGTVDHPLDWLSSSSIQYNIGAEFDYKEDCEDFKQIKFTKQYEIEKHGTYIGNDVWIGSLVIIKCGLTIGDGAVIAAGSVVTKDVPPYAIVGGVPAKVIRYRFDENIITKLQKLKWWDRDLKELNGIQFDNIKKAIEQLGGKEIKESFNLKEAIPKSIKKPIKRILKKFR